MAEDPKTRSLLLCVMDGHGEDGDKVSQNIKSKFASYLFKHPDFAGNVKTALTDVIARCEAEILRGINYVEPRIILDYISCQFHFYDYD